MALDNTCTRCGTPNPFPNRLCANCGELLVEVPPAAAEPEHLSHAPEAPPVDVALDLPAWLWELNADAPTPTSDHGAEPRGGITGSPGTPQLPAWLAAGDPELAPASSHSGASPAAEDVMPSWLGDATTGSAAPPSPPDRSSDVPAWLRDDQVQASGEEQVPDATPSWLQEPHADPEDNSRGPAEHAGSPGPATFLDRSSWLRDLDQEPTTKVNVTPQTNGSHDDFALPPTASPAEPAPEAWPDPESSSLPDWLMAPMPDRPAGAAAATLPSWLLDDSHTPGEPTTPTPDTWLTATGPEPAARAADDLMSWLYEPPTMAGRTGNEATRLGPGGHVARMYPVAGEEVDATTPAMPASGMPPWLAGMKPASSTSTSSLPPWLSDLAAPVDSAVVNGAELGDTTAQPSQPSRLPPWLEEPEPSGPASDTTIANWLQEPAPASTGTSPAFPGEEGLVESLELPAWGNAEEPAGVQETPATSVPVWLHEPDTGTQAVEEVDEEPDLAAAPVVMPEIERSPERMEAIELLNRLLVEPAPEPDTAAVELVGTRQSWLWLLMASLILLAAILFILLSPRLNLSFGPPPTPRPGVRQIGEQMAALAPNRPVLIAYEWDLRRVAEIEPLEENLLASFITRRTPLLLLTTEPQGALLARRRAALLRGRTDGFYDQEGLGFVDLGYQSGGALALARLRTSFGSILDQRRASRPLAAPQLIESLCATSADGPAGCSFDRLGMLVVLADEREDAQAWIEQVASSSPDIPVIFAVPAELGPFVEPYLTRPNWSMIAGLDGALALQTTRGVVDDWIGRQADATAVGQAAFAILLVIGAIPALWTSWRARRSNGAEPWPD